MPRVWTSARKNPEAERCPPRGVPPSVARTNCRKGSLPRLSTERGGWYETDFKTGSKKNLAGESGGSTGSGRARQRNPIEAPITVLKSGDGIR